MDSIRRKPVLTPPPRPNAPSPTSATSLPPQHRRPTPTSKRPRKLRRNFTWLKRIILLLFVLLLSIGGYFAWKITSVSRSVRIDNTSAQSAFTEIQSLAASFFKTEHKPLRGEEGGRINILLLGKAGEHHPGRNLTDTVMIMSLDTAHKKISLLSLPRDLYVEVPKNHVFMKINSVYQYSLNQEKGAALIQETVEEITGLPLHYFLIIDFDGFEKVIDALGGINVNVERDIYDPRYPGPNYSYETFELKKGLQTLDGKTALKYVRERHNDPEGDFGRAKRQQQVIQAVKNKAFSIRTFMNALALNELLNVLGENIKTNIAPDEIESFIHLSRQMDTQNITNVVIDAWKKDSLLKVSHVFVGENNQTRMFILVPRVGNWSEIQDVAANLFTLDALKRRQEAIATEKASIALLVPESHSSLASRIQHLLQESFGFAQVDILPLPSDFASFLPEKSSLIDRANRSKPFTLDEILKKLPVLIETDAEPLSEIPSSAEEYDFLLLVGSDLKSFDFDDISEEDFKNTQENE